MIELKVESARCFEGHPTAAAAVLAARGGTKFERELRASPRISEVAFDENSFVLRLEDGRDIVFALAKNAIVEGRMNDGRVSVSKRGFPDILYLAFSKQQRVRWGRRHIPHLMRDRHVIKVLANPPAIFLYVSGAPTVMLWPLRIRDTNEHLLHWEHVD